MWTLFDHIKDLMEKRGTIDTKYSESETVQDFTKKKLLNVYELWELFESSSRIRNSLNFIRSFWEFSLLIEIQNFFKSLCIDDSDYQNIFKDVEFLSYDFDTYVSSFNALYSAVWLLEDKRYLSEMKATLDFLRKIDKSEFRPLSDEALRRKFSKNC